MKMTRDDLAALLDDIKARVLAGDSWEGRISYTAMDEDLLSEEVRVEGCYRIGNTEGQGGIRMIASDRPETSETESPT